MTDTSPAFLLAICCRAWPAAAIAAAGQSQQKIASKKVGEVSVTYATGASSSSVSAFSDLAELTETSFGLQLLSLLRLYSMTRYVL